MLSNSTSLLNINCAKLITRNGSGIHASLLLPKFCPLLCSYHPESRACEQQRHTVRRSRVEQRPGDRHRARSLRCSFRRPDRFFGIQSIQASSAHQEVPVPSHNAGPRWHADAASHFAAHLAPVAARPSPAPQSADFGIRSSPHRYDRVAQRHASTTLV